MHNTRAMLMLAHFIWCNGHIRATDTTKVKLTKIRTIMQHGWDAKSHVIVNIVASAHCEIGCGGDHGG